MAGRSALSFSEVRLWGASVGLVAWDPALGYAAFEYAPEFLATGIELSPVMMPLAPGSFAFPALNKETFRGLPGLLADSLPDRFGNSLIDQWLAESGRSIASFTQSWFYSDSHNDLALLDAVTHPVVVNGDETLRALAEKRHWESFSTHTA